MSICSITSRWTRGTAGTLLLAYSILVLVLTLHHHGDATIAVRPVLDAPSASPVSHGHSSAQCPLQYYSVYAFQVEPGDSNDVPILSASSISVPESDAFPRFYSGASFLSRGPPALV
jgi:hypothetical protein